MIRLYVLALGLTSLITEAYCGSHQDGAVVDSKLRMELGQLPLLHDMNTLFRSDGSLQPRQLQNCTSDPSSIACANSTVCCSKDYPVCVSNALFRLASITLITDCQQSVRLKIGAALRVLIAVKDNRIAAVAAIIAVQGERAVQKAKIASPRAFVARKTRKRASVQTFVSQTIKSAVTGPLTDTATLATSVWEFRMV